MPSYHTVRRAKSQATRFKACAMRPAKDTTQPTSGTGDHSAYNIKLHISIRLELLQQSRPVELVVCACLEIIGA